MEPFQVESAAWCDIDRVYTLTLFDGRDYDVATVELYWDDSAPVVTRVKCQPGTAEADVRAWLESSPERALERCREVRLWAAKPYKRFPVVEREEPETEHCAGCSQCLGVPNAMGW